MWGKKAEFRAGVIHIIIGPCFLWTHSGGQGFNKIMGQMSQIYLH